MKSHKQVPINEESLQLEVLVNQPKILEGICGRDIIDAVKMKSFHKFKNYLSL